MISFVYTVHDLSNKQFPRCMEHALHLGAGHFIQVVSPRSGHILVKKIKKAFHDAKLDDDNIDFDALKADLGGDNNDADDDDNDDNAALEAAELLCPSSRRSRSWILVSKDNCVRVSHVSVNPACHVSKWMKSWHLA